MANNTTIIFNQVAKTGTFGSVIDAVNSNFDLAKIAILNMKGKSAYEIWREQDGNENKTQDEFLASLKESGFTSQAVQSLPTTNIDPKKIYAVPVDSESWAEKIYSNGNWITLAIHNESGLSSVISDVDDLKQRSEPIVFTDSKACNSFIKTLFVDVNGAGNIDLWITVAVSSSYLFIYDSNDTNATAICSILIKADESLYCTRTSQGVYVWLEIDYSKFPSSSITKAKLTSWATSSSFDPRKNLDGMTESPILNKYIKEMWVEFADNFDGDKSEIVDKLCVYGMSNTVETGEGEHYGDYKRQLFIRKDGNTSANFFEIPTSQKYGQEPEIILYALSSTVKLHAKIDWEGLKGLSFSAFWMRLAKKCYIPAYFENNSVELSDNIGDSSSIALSQKGGKALREEIMSMIPSDDVKEYTTNSALNKFLKRLYIDLSNYTGNEITIENGVPTNIEVQFNRYNDGKVFIIRAKNTDGGNTTYTYLVYLTTTSYGEKDCYGGSGFFDNSLTGVFFYFEPNWDEIPSNTITGTANALAFDNNEDPRMSELRYVDNPLIDRAIKSLYINPENWAIVSSVDNTSIYFRNIFNGSSSLYGFEVKTDENSNVSSYARNTDKSRILVFSSKDASTIRGLFLYAEVDWDALSDYPNLIPFVKPLANSFTLPDPTRENDVKNALYSVPATRISPYYATEISLASRTISNNQVIGSLPAAFAELAKRTNGDDCDGIIYRESDFETPQVVGSDTAIIKVESQEDFDDLDSNIKTALNDNAIQHIEVYIKQGIYFAKGKDANNSEDIGNVNTANPHISLTGNYANKTISIIGDKGAKIVVGKHQYQYIQGSTGHEDCGEYYAIPHSEEFIYSRTYLDEALNYIDIVNANNFVETLTNLTKDTSLSTTNKNVWKVTVRKEDCPAGIVETDDTWCIITAAWTSNKGRVVKTEENEDGNTTVWFVNNYSEQLINSDAGYGNGKARFKLMNDRARMHGILIRGGKMYIPKSIGKVTECRFDRFISLVNISLNKFIVKGVEFIGGAYVNGSSGLIYLSKANNGLTRIEKCKFTNIGSRVIRINDSVKGNDNTKNVEFVDNVVEGTLGSAISTGRYHDVLKVVGNVFSDIGRSHGQSECILGQGTNIYIGHNKFFDFNYTGVRCGVWDSTNKVQYDDTTTAIIEFNEFFHTEKYKSERFEHVLMDGAPIYMSNRNMGLIIRYNFVHDVIGWRDRYAGIYLDGGCQNASVYGNLIINSASNGVYIMFRESTYNDYLSACNLNNACVGNITDRSIWFDGNPHLDGEEQDAPSSSDYEQAVVGGNVILYYDIRPNITKPNTVNKIEHDGIEYELPDVYVKEMREINGEVWLPPKVFSAVRKLPFPEFILQHIHKDVDIEATDV